MLERASGLDRAGLIPRLADPVPSRTVDFVEGMVERRRRGEPLQYVLGLWSFRRLELVVDRRVLIPRPETEMVVEVALAELARLDPARPLVVDLGTGSGAIAISMALEAPAARVWGTDRSEEALAVARANLAGMGGRVAPRVRLAVGDWFAALPRELRRRFDLIVANPPYVGADEVLPPEVADWEPAGALVAGPTGLEAVAAILDGAPTWLRRPGAVVVEIAPHQAGRAFELACDAGFPEVDVHPDLAGRPRALVGRLPE
ncbi:MAG: Peptide chain release factor N(5)-glutamine methyltransferase [uncultured Acidimicrobiales bacterium]|uniref:peptide chain release factor N(5)-glutamine methyltransferase n=1 Tax=uncultured Acidimicrobiales bacterium TaxID=310071 RepID=A0A6J4IS95_9ACTN|nr:MAG: Peptide chain release factor N(5)-glutamine methyltransferase [uncultured Acidimicrobiales bacterium]